MRSNSLYDMVPEFFVAAFSIKPGEITQTLVKTSYGWHVIRVEDRRLLNPPNYEDILDNLESGLQKKIMGGYCGCSARKGGYYSFQSRWLAPGIIFGEIKQNTPRMFPRTNREWFLGTAT